jgi:hypothetical protein
LLILSSAGSWAQTGVATGTHRYATAAAANPSGLSTRPGSTSGREAADGSRKGGADDAAP